MKSTFVVANMMNYDGSYEYILEEAFCHASVNSGEVIMIFPYMGENCDKKLRSLAKFISENGYSAGSKIHFALDQSDMLSMTNIDCKCLAINGVSVHTKGDTIRLQSGIKVQCDDLTKDSFTEEELDDMFLELQCDFQNLKNHVYALAWDGSSVDNRLLRFSERLLLVSPISNDNLFKAVSYHYDDKELLTYSLGIDKKEYVKTKKYIFIEEKELDYSDNKTVKVR